MTNNTPKEAQTLDRAEDLLLEHGFTLSGIVPVCEIELLEHGFTLSGIVPVCKIEWDDDFRTGDWIVDLDEWYDTPNVFALNLKTGRYWFKELPHDNFASEAKAIAYLLRRSEYNSPGQLSLKVNDKPNVHAGY